jgi:hypothetical protein
MSLDLNDVHAAQILWHDAEVYHITTVRREDGDLTIYLHVDINSDEDLTSMKAIGLYMTSLLIEYRHVWRCVSDMRGDSSPREVIIDWRVIQDSDLIKPLNAVKIIPNMKLRHHQYQFSGGSQLDIVFEEMQVSPHSHSNTNLA